jgi:hypothetical protein
MSLAEYKKTFAELMKPEDFTDEARAMLLECLATELERARWNPAFKEEALALAQKAREELQKLTQARYARV